MVLLLAAEHADPASEGVRLFSLFFTCHLLSKGEATQEMMWAAQAKHFKCTTCHKKLSSASGLRVHCSQVHRFQISSYVLYLAPPFSSYCAMPDAGAHTSVVQCAGGEAWAGRHGGGGVWHGWHPA